MASQPDEDEEPIEWGDMDPAFSRMLQSTPSMLTAYKALRAPKKMAKLDASTGSFQPSTDLPMPEASPEVKFPETVTLENLRSTIQHYHDTSIQPSIDLLNQHIRQEITSRIDRTELQQVLGSYSLNALESEQQRRAVIIYNIPQFSNMSTITQNLNYLLSVANLSNSDVQSVSNHLHTSSSAFMRVIFLQESSSRQFLQQFKQKKRYWHSPNQDDSQLRIEKDMSLQERLDRIPLMTIIEVLNNTPPTDSLRNPYHEIYLKPELNSLQLWTSDNETLLAQVIYLPGRNMQYQCHLYLHKDIYTLILEHFPKLFGAKIKQFLMFAQAYTQSARHATTALRYHHGQTKDISNISTTEAFRFFPYDIYPLELDAALTVQLIENPAFLIQGFSGLQPLIQQAMQDSGLSYSDYGVKGKGKNEGKGKDKSLGKKSSGKGWGNSRKGEIFERLEQEGKGNKNSRSKPYQPFNRTGEVQDYSQTSRPSAWYTSKDYDKWENDSGWPQFSSSSNTRSQDNSKGWNSAAPKGKGQNRSISEPDTNIFPCDECMALAGTNQSCNVCIHEHWQHFEKLTSSFRSISKFQQPILPSFPCPAQLPDGENCSAIQSTFGNGECFGCVLFRDYLFKYHSQRNPPLSPYHSALYIGYERSVIAVLEESSYELLDALRDATYTNTFEDFVDSFKDWWDQLVNPVENDPLYELPKFTDLIEYEIPKKTNFMMKQPYFTQLGNSIHSCNIQQVSMLLTICNEAFAPVIENVITEYGLPLPSEVPSLQLTTRDVLGLVLLPWDHMVRTSYSLALQQFQITPKWELPALEALLNTLLPSEEQCYLEQFAQVLVEVTHGHKHLLDVLSGQAPFTNAPLKKLASAGSYYFDHVYAQIGSLLKVQTTTKQNLVAANDSLGEIYDTYFRFISPDSPLFEYSDALLQRHWNNKGNSMESLSLLLAELGFHHVVWIMGWICIQLSYKNKSYSFLNPYVLP